MITLIGWRRRAATVSAPLLAAAIAFLLLCSVTAACPDQAARSWLSNVGSALLAVGASAGCLRAARNARGRARRGWAALSLACLSWGAGQVVWTVLESVLGEATPYPSVADIGYLGFPVLALAAFFWLSPPAVGTQVPRRLLDGLTVGCAISLVAWLSVLGTVTHSPGDLAAAVVALIYPIGDVVLLTMAVLTITQSRGRPDGWRRLWAGALAMAWSDGAFAYLTSQDGYHSGGVADWGWWAAFCLFGVAGARVRPPGVPSRPADQRGESNGLLAYLTLGAAGLAVVIAYVRGEQLDGVAGVLTVLLVGLVMIRQYVALRENRALARAVQAREAQLHRLAFHDALTGLANRALFLDRLGHALDLAAREPRPVSVVFCDLDGFKAVNDSLGHAIGDALLAGVAGRFRSVLRASDTLARLGGDEFAVLVEQADDRAVETVAQAMLRALDEPFSLDGRTVAVSASIGLATADPRRSPEPAASLLHRADVAMYAVKASGRGDVRIHDRVRDRLDVTPDPGRPPHPVAGPSSTRTGLADALADALDRRAVRAVFQPVVDPVSGRIFALEALARWTHEGREIGPDVFVPIAERTGLTAPLTSLMLEHACEQLGRWSRRLGHGRLRVAVNISPADLADAGLPERVQRLITRHGLTRGQLALEVTETEMWRPDEVLDVLHALRSIGVRIAIDDFGTGHSSLSRLASLPLDTLKLDRIFVTDIDHDEARLQFLAGLLNLARHLGLRTIAEGVERPGQLLALRRLECDLVQGWLTGRPTSADNLTPLLLADTTMLPFGLQPSWRAGAVNPVLTTS